MNRKIAVLAVLCALALACDPLSRTEMTLTFDDSGERVNVDVVSDDNHLQTYHRDDRDHIGEDILAGRDEWSIRFARATPQDERLVMNRSNGSITRVENQASINTADLQKFFFDVGVSVQTTQGDGWTELTMYAGHSTRATLREQETVKRELDEFSHLAVTYFDSLREMYAYLAANDARSEEVFYGVYAGFFDAFGKEFEQPRLSEKEQLMVDHAVKAVRALQEGTEKDGKELSRLADLVYNPFPAVIDVRVPGEPLSVEGFERDNAGMLRATTATPDKVLQRLEGRWVAPDLFAAAERLGKIDGREPTPREVAAALAMEPRRFASVVNASDVVEALVKGMQPAPRYRVRWVTKAGSKDGSTGVPKKLPTSP